MSDLISRKDLMKKIAHHTVHDSMSYVTFERSTVYEMVKGDMFGLVKDAPAVAAMPRWISVEERLPVIFESVIGYLPVDEKEGYPPTREVYRTERGWFAPALGELCIVTHWTSMPEGFREV